MKEIGKMEEVKKLRTTNGAAALKEYQESGRKRAKPEYNRFKKFLKRKTPLNAIAAKCWVCKGGTEDSGERTGLSSKIRDCERSETSSDPCPLFDMRPYKPQPSI